MSNVADFIYLFILSFPLGELDHSFTYVQEHKVALALEETPLFRHKNIWCLWSADQGMNFLGLKLTWLDRLFLTQNDILI